MAYMESLALRGMHQDEKGGFVDLPARRKAGLINRLGKMLAIAGELPFPDSETIDFQLFAPVHDGKVCPPVHKIWHRDFLDRTGKDQVFSDTYRLDLDREL